MYDLKTLESEHQQSQEVLLYFKTGLCPSLHQDVGLPSNNRGCFQAPCYYYHNMHEMRRPLFDEQSERLNYDPVPCGSLQEGLPCAEGNRCRFSHTQNELSYHPLYYKTEPCSGCMFGNNTRLCPKYHSEETNRRSLVEKILSQQEINDTHAQNQFNLDLFKVMPCTKKANHNLKICNYYHHDKDRRRPTNVYSYAPPMCSYVSRNLPCPMGDKCNYAHNKLEQLYHPERYKRKFCQFHPNNIHKCDYGDYCSFAHKENEIVIELLHNIKQDEYFYLYKYKTVFCPYISEHDRNLCVYAHNPQDLRRDPSQTKYNAIQCSFWSQGQIYSYEEGGCPKQMECENCHGWKELEYHPLYYKTKPCNNGKKCNKKDCPFYHSNSEKRQVKVTSQLTRSLFLLNNSPLKPKVANNAGSSQAFESEPLKASSEKKLDSAQQRTLVPLFIPFKLNESDNMRKPDVRSCGFGSFLPSTNFTEDEFAGSSIKPKVQTFELHANKFGSGSISGEVNSEKSRPETTKNLFSQPVDLWGSFQPGHEDKLEDFLKSIHRSSQSKPGRESYMNKSFDSNGESSTQEKMETFTEKSAGLSNQQFKKSFVNSLEKKGLSHTIQYLINPMIDLKALKSFSQKDFPLFPHISQEEKLKIVKIIQDILEEDALLSEVNTVNDFEVQGRSFFSDEGSFSKQLGSFDKDQDFMFNLTNQLERFSHQ